MVARLNSLFVFILISIVSVSACAGEKSMDEKVTSIAVAKVQEAVSQLRDRIEKCKEKEVVLKPSSLTLPEISEKNMMVALLYLSSKAAKHCEGDLWAKLSYALGHYNNVVSHYEIKKRVKFKYEEFVNVHAWREFKLQVQYDELEPETKKILESNHQLEEPFDPIKLFKEIEKANKTSHRLKPGYPVE